MTTITAILLMAHAADLFPFKRVRISIGRGGIKMSGNVLTINEEEEDEDVTGLLADDDEDDGGAQVSLDMPKIMLIKAVEAGKLVIKKYYEGKLQKSTMIGLKS